MMKEFRRFGNAFKPNSLQPIAEKASPQGPFFQGTYSLKGLNNPLSLRVCRGGRSNLNLSGVLRPRGRADLVQHLNRVSGDIDLSAAETPCQIDTEVPLEIMGNGCPLMCDLA